MKKTSEKIKNTHRNRAFNLRYTVKNLAFTAGTNQQCDTLYFWSHHPGGAHFALADGAIKFLNYEAFAEVMPQLAMKSGGEVFSTAW